MLLNKRKKKKKGGFNVKLIDCLQSTKREQVRHFFLFHFVFNLLFCCSNSKLIVGRMQKTNEQTFSLRRKNIITPNNNTKLASTATITHSVKTEGLMYNSICHLNPIVLVYCQKWQIEKAYSDGTAAGSGTITI